MRSLSESFPMLCCASAADMPAPGLRSAPSSLSVVGGGRGDVGDAGLGCQVTCPGFGRGGGGAGAGAVPLFSKAAMRSRSEPTLRGGGSDMVLGSLASSRVLVTLCEQVSESVLETTVLRHTLS